MNHEFLEKNHPGVYRRVQKAVEEMMPGKCVADYDSEELLGIWLTYEGIHGYTSVIRETVLALENS